MHGNGITHVNCDHAMEQHTDSREEKEKSSSSLSSMSNGLVLCKRSFGRFYWFSPLQSSLEHEEPWRLIKSGWGCIKSHLNILIRLHLQHATSKLLRRTLDNFPPLWLCALRSGKLNFYTLKVHIKELLNEWGENESELQGLVEKGKSFIFCVNYINVLGFCLSRIIIKMSFSPRSMVCWKFGCF